MITCASPKSLDETRNQEIIAVMENVLRSGHYILGEQVSQFEIDFSIAKDFFLVLSPATV